MFGPRRPLIRMERMMAFGRHKHSRFLSPGGVGGGRRSFAQPHPNLPGAVAFHQLEVLAQAVVGAEAHFEDLDSAAVHSEERLRAGSPPTLSWTGNLPGQGLARHHLIHGQGWLGTIIPTSFSQETEEEKKKSNWRLLLLFRCRQVEE